MFDWSMTLSLVTAAAAILALFMTNRQIRQSNKQALFDKRLALWTTAQGLMELFGRNRNQFDTKKDEVFFSNNLLFTWLTNNAFLSDISPTLDHALDSAFQFDFLRKLEEIQKLAVEASLIFRGNTSRYLGEFLDDYQALLFKMYQYQILINHMTDDANRFRWTLEEATDRLDEPAYRNHLFSAYKKLDASYEKFCNPSIQKKIERQIKLS